jgi:hypothetical protein
MQKHEGPRPDPVAEERRRQRVLTGRLLGVIAVLVAAIGVVLLQRWI